MAFIVPTFLWSDIVRLYHYINKKMLARKVTKAGLDGSKSLILIVNL